jgi:hypothetical protein
VRRMFCHACFEISTYILSSGIKRPGLEATHSPPFSAEVKIRATMPPRRYTSARHDT